MTLNEPPPTRAVLILANGQREVIEMQTPLELDALIGQLWRSAFFAGYILQPSQKTIEESRRKI